MAIMNPGRRAVVEAAVHWKSDLARHVDRHYFASVPLEQLPGELGGGLQSSAPGTPSREVFAAGELVPGYDRRLVISIDRGQFKTRPRPRLQVVPRLGRFYPLGFLSSTVIPVDDDRRPFRIVSLNDRHMTIDVNHPLARFPLTVEATVLGWTPGDPKPADLDLARALTAGGPGMQAIFSHSEIDQLRDEDFAREDSREDTEFYTKPRLVQHIDSRARQTVSGLYGRFLQSGMHVLDLMSSWESHLPALPTGVQVTGLGLNRHELEQNARLHAHCVQDLNLTQILPFAERTFDLVVCTVSVEYLAKPIAVFREVARILKPGGRFVLTFSDRWFPTKAIRLWSELHAFERLALVLEFFRQSAGFVDLYTESWRGWPRPSDDQYCSQLEQSDPVFAVWGSRSG